MAQTAFVYTDAYVQYAYSDTHPLKPERLKLTRDLIHSYELLELPTSRVIETQLAQRAELETFHTADYLEVLESADGGVYRMDYAAYGLGPGDNPIFPGMYAWAQLCAGGTLQATRLVEAGTVDRAFHIAGGLHHGMPDRASGFCYVNDPVIAILELLHKGYRVAYIDIDVHHGDGVQAAFYHTDRVLTISLHESGAYLFPGTGFVHEMGAGQGHGYAVNVPLPPGVDDELLVTGFMAIVPPLVEAFQADFVFTQLGVDSFHNDPLAHGEVTTAGFARVLQEIKTLAPRWIATGGGGYNLPNVARAWTLAWGIMNDLEVPDELPASAIELIQQTGYRGSRLRDAALPQHTRRDRYTADLQEVITAVQQQVFPIHGLRA